MDLPASQKIVILALADQANDEGYCWPAIPTIARRCSKSERTVFAMLLELEESGHLSRRQRTGTSTVYIIHPNRMGGGENLAPASIPEILAPALPQISQGGGENLAPKPPKNHQRTTIIGKAKKKLHPLPEDFSAVLTPSAVVAIKDWSRDRLERELDQFKNYHTAKGSMMKCWQAAFRTWIGNANKFNRGEERNDRKSTGGKNGFLNAGFDEEYRDRFS
jgi:hypothetical protein